MIVAPLVEALVDEAADVLARAFFDYPLWPWLEPDAARRSEVLRPFMAMSLRYGMLAGETYVTAPDVSGAAIWMPPQYDSVDLDPDGSRCGYFDVIKQLGADGERRLDVMSAVQQEARRAHVPPGAWYLQWLGVAPDVQRTGTGASLLAPMLRRLDDAGAACVLETENVANVAYYGRHGFKLVHEGVLPEGGPGFWTMVR